MPLEDIALFYRVNALSRIYEDALRQARIPYRVIGGLRFYDRAEIKDLLAYLHIVYNPGNNLAMLRIINTPKRGLGKVALSNMLAYADEHRLSIFEIISDPEHLAGAGIKGKAAAACSVFANQIVNWVQVAPGFQLKALMERILDETDYRVALGDPKSLEVLSRLENINEFVGSLGQYQEQQPKSTLGEYLESAALRAADEEAAAEPGVSLMTVHNAKGLEFDVVFIVALEEEIFPNARAVRDQGHVEEERRLFYVALTRARKRVYLTHATARSLYGKMEFPVPSVFIREIPEKLLVSLFEASLKPVQHRSVPKHPEWRQPRPEKKGALPTPELVVQPKQHFLHEILGEVEIVREEGVGRDQRFVVKDLGGAEHMLIAAYADLKPVGNKAIEHEVRTETTGQTEDDDALPF